MAGIGVPVSGDNHVCDQVPAAVEIVVHKGFDEGLVDAGAVVVAGKGPEVADQTAIGAPFGLDQDDAGGTGAPLARSELFIGRRGQHDRRTDAPDEPVFGR